MLPMVSIVIPTYNEQKNIKNCLDSLIKQNYPKDLMEIIVVDNRSTDNTVNLVEDYTKQYENIKLLFNDIAKDAEISKMIGLRNSTGDLFMYLDADIEVAGTDWLMRLVKPHIREDDIVGSFPRFVPKPNDVAIGRYLRYHPLELDPILRFFCTEINETIVADRGDYKICVFIPPKVPPIGICLYKRTILVDVLWDMERFMDIDVPVILSKRGYNKFAYVHSCGIYHVNVRSLKDLVKRRTRNIHKTYLPNVEKREFLYFNFEDPRCFIKATLWVLYANLFIPKLIEGICKAFKFKDAALLYEPLVSILLTDVIIVEFLKNTKGRSLLFRLIKG